MNKVGRSKILVLYFLLFSLFALSANAQVKLSDAVKDLAVLDIVQTYFTIPSLVDFVILLVFFINITRPLLKKRELSPNIGYVFAVVFAIGGVIGLNELNTNLVMFARPILLLLTAIFVIQNFMGDNKKLNMGIGFLIISRIMDFLGQTIKGVQIFPFYNVIGVLFLFAGIVITAIGFWEAVSSAVKGEGKEGHEGEHKKSHAEKAAEKKEEEKLTPAEKAKLDQTKLDFKRKMDKVEIELKKLKKEIVDWAKYGYQVVLHTKAQAVPTVGISEYGMGCANEAAVSGYITGPYANNIPPPQAPVDAGHMPPGPPAGASPLWGVYHVIASQVGTSKIDTLLDEINKKLKEATEIDDFDKLIDLSLFSAAVDQLYLYLSAWDGYLVDLDNYANDCRAKFATGPGPKTLIKPSKRMIKLPKGVFK